jgi:hypothetical protein
MRPLQGRPLSAHEALKSPEDIPFTLPRIVRIPVVIV